MTWGWKIAAWINKRTISECINEQIVQHMNGYYFNDINTRAIFMNAAMDKQVLQ